MNVVYVLHYKATFLHVINRQVYPYSNLMYEGVRGYLALSVCWKSLQAIETFAVTVKEIAQLLQSFGTELAEIELPDEANAIEYLLTAHTDKYRQMKVGVTHLN